MLMTENALGPDGAVALAPALAQLTQLTALGLYGECYVCVWDLLPCLCAGARVGGTVRIHVRVSG